jgi:hypothetical protein
VREIILSLTRASIVAKHEGRHDDYARIGRGIAAMLSLNTDDDDDHAAPTVGTPGTRIGIGPSGAA